MDLRVRGVFRASKSNIEDENFAVDLPIFVIHGNHDDPTFDGGEVSLLTFNLGFISITCIPCSFLSLVRRYHPLMFLVKQAW